MKYVILAGVKIGKDLTTKRLVAQVIRRVSRAVAEVIHAGYVNVIACRVTDPPEAVFQISVSLRAAEEVEYLQLGPLVLHWRWYRHITMMGDMHQKASSNHANGARLKAF